ncbi:MAG: D-fructose-6-phosphate amidotransferase [SAR202 cluster bacterium Io17-Chloro-G9]|nr:MAG: D-fructose-6-phosphate amidotransferase [SAR202 cluster bacterium Io17-Chloro-G9]
MAAYVLVDIEVTDQGTYDDYRRQVPPLVEKYGGKYLVRGGELEQLEGDWMPKRLVVIEFPSSDKAKEFYDSEEYRPLKELRMKATNSKMVLAEGA